MCIVLVVGKYYMREWCVNVSVVLCVWEHTHHRTPASSTFRGPAKPE